MASGLIQVTPELLEGNAKTVRNLRAEHDQTMTKLKNLINGLQQSWQGEAQKAMVSQYEAMQPTFKKFSEQLESYAKGMDDSAKIMREADAKAAQNVKNTVGQ